MSKQVIEFIINLLKVRLEHYQQQLESETDAEVTYRLEGGINELNDLIKILNNLIESEYFKDNPPPMVVDTPSEVMSTLQENFWNILA